jgi:hypothetical protein
MNGIELVNARSELAKGLNAIDQNERLNPNRQRLPVRPQTLPPKLLTLNVIGHAGTLSYL